MASLYWIEESLPGLLPCLWMAGAVGLPWALAAISRRAWRSYAMVGALALAFGPAWLCAWMLVLGVVGAQLELRLLTAEWILAGSGVIGLLGAALAWRKRHLPRAVAHETTPLASDEKLVIGLIVIAVALRWIHTAYFPFTAYDALWVYGYQGRLFFLEGFIPNEIGYYPPFLSLQFAFVQTLLGEVNDHAARMVLPLMHIGSILAAYLLGKRLASRRVGLISAALWCLHPHVGQWAFRGDLEIPLTFSFTLAAVFLLSAWREQDNGDRRRQAILAGAVLGIALFTKPTAGAFLWGVLLLLAIELARKRLSIRRCLPQFRIALWAGLTCLPLGAVWYARNLLLGHEAVTLPKGIWLTRALRTGDYLAPLILIAATGVVALALRRRLSRWEAAISSAGLALLFAGALASNAALFPARVDPPASYVQPAEALLMLAGLVFAGLGLRRAIRSEFAARVTKGTPASVLCLLLALPYFVTLFYSYSYHYRLGFAILPLLCLPSAIALGEALDRARMRSWRKGRQRAYGLVLLLACLPGVAAVVTDVRWSSIWLLRSDLDSDFEKYEYYNPSLMQIVAGLEDYKRDTQSDAMVLAPGEERLPFFFPQMPIHVAAATTLDELEALGATHVVFGAKAREAYLDAGIDPAMSQLVAALGRTGLFEKVRSHYHGVFSYELYEVGDIAGRWRLPAKFAAREDELDTVVFDGRLQLHAYGVYPPVIHEELPITFEPTWKALRTLTQDYEFLVQVRHASGETGYEWRLAAAPHRHGAYQTSLWQAGEYVNDLQVFALDKKANLNDKGFSFWVAVWDGANERYLPLAINGEAAGEFYRLAGSYHLRS